MNSSYIVNKILKLATYILTLIDISCRKQYFTGFFCLFFCSSIPVTYAAVNVIVLVSARTKSATLPRYLKTVETIQNAVHTYNTVIEQKPELNRLKLNLYILAQGEKGKKEYSNTWEIYGSKETVGGPPHKPFTSLNDFNELVDELMTKFDLAKNPEKESTLVIIVGHGATCKIKSEKLEDTRIGPSTGTQPEKTLEDTQICPWGPTPPGELISFSDLKEAIRPLAEKTPVRIACLTCFGGRVHQLALELDNICTLSVSPFCMTTTNSHEVPESSFNKGFFDYFSKIDASHTFSEAAQSGYKQDAYNTNLGSLSSSHYIDSIIGRGPCNKLILDLIINGKMIPDNFTDPQNKLNDPRYAILQACDHFSNETSNEKYSFPPIRTLGSENIQCTKALVYPNTSFIETLTALLNTSTQADREKSKNEWEVKIEKLEKDEHKIPEKLLSKIRKEINLFYKEIDIHFNQISTTELELYRSKMESFFQDLLALRNIYATHIAKDSIVNGELNTKLLLKELMDAVLREKNIEIEKYEKYFKSFIDKIIDPKKLSTLYSELRNSHHILYNYSQTFERITNLLDFFQSNDITDGQKEKLIKLLKYEWEDIVLKN